jgi:hypothetical protein
MAERRFCVLDAGADHREDYDFFKAIDAEMNNGGREALLHYLLDYDLATVNLRAIPKTTALLDQKLATLTAEQGWWLDLLRSGQLPHGAKDHRNEAPAALLFDHYVRYAGCIGARHKALETQLGIFLRKGLGAELLRSRNRTYVDKYGIRHRLSSATILLACLPLAARGIG